MSENTQQDAANVELTKAHATSLNSQAICGLVANGFTHESAVASVHSGDLTKLAKE